MHVLLSSVENTTGGAWQREPAPLKQENVSYTTDPLARTFQQSLLLTCHAAFYDFSYVSIAAHNPQHP